MKTLKWLVVLLILVAIAAALYLLFPRRAKTPPGASLLPADTFLFVQMPDVAKARQDFRTTALWQIASEKEVKDFLGKTVDAIRAGYKEHAGDNPWANLLKRAPTLAGGELFLAVPELGAMSRNIPPLVLGVDVREHTAEADRWVAELKTKLKEEFPKFTEESANYKGVAYQRWTTPDATIAHRYFGTMLVVTSKPETMEQIIDRTQDKAAATLEKDPRYRNAVQRMPADHAALVYCNPKPLVAMLKGFALFMPQLQSTMKNADAVQAAAYTTTFRNGSFLDVLFIDAPEATRGEMGGGVEPTKKTTLPLTSENALVYSVQSMDLGKAWDTAFTQLQGSPIPKLQAFLFELEKFNRAHGWNLPKSLLDGVGPEYAFSLNWETNAPLPGMFLALQVRDKTKAAAALDQLWQWAKTTQPTGLDPFAEIEYKGAVIHSLQTPFVSPGYAVTDKFVLLSLQTDALKTLIDKQTTGGRSLADNARYQKATGALPTGGYSYSYLDTSNLFTRVYTLLEPRIKTLAAATASANDYLDMDKLPQAGTIAKHLQPSAATQIVDKDGFTTVIVSPVGMPVVTFGALVGAGVAIAQHFPGFPMR